MKPGPTGDYPLGKLNEDDEGGLDIGIGVDGEDNVVINFGKQVCWLAMPKQAAIEFALLILQKAGVQIDRQQFEH